MATKKPKKTKGVPAKKRTARAPAKKARAPRAPARKRPRSAPRKRRTYAEMFVDRLTALGGDELLPVTNPQLREDLKWDEARYARVKAQLVAEGMIVIGPGRGGTVGLARATRGAALKIFVSYSHVDDKLRDAVVKHLRPLERMKLVSQWHDRKLMAGDTWDQEISRNLDEADIVLLLVSIDFINSKYCYDVELERALERHEAGECKVVPVILRGCLWQHTPFSKLQAVPKDGRPVTAWTDTDEALANVADAIRTLAEDLLARR